jgi:hypothetical protein
MLRSRRLLLLAIATLCLAVAAGVMAVRAFASGDEVYCNSCSLPANGIPHVSSERWTFIQNSIAFTVNTHSEIQNYNANLNQTWCKVAFKGSTGGSNNCAPPTKADARCHMIDGYGPNTARCDAIYSG